jgi:hypothetical protein
MKFNRFSLILVAAALAAGTSSFFITRHRVCGSCYSARQTKTFQVEALRLADMLESETASRDQMMNQARKVFSIRQENIIAAVTEALKTDSGRKTILDLIPAPVDANQTKMDMQAGYCCVGPGCCCKFDSVQSQKLAQSDPNFLKASSVLESQMSHLRQSLISMLNNRAVPDERILSAVRDYLEKTTILEIRAVEYLISIKPCLTAEQQKQIFCWCARQLRDNAK